MPCAATIRICQEASHEGTPWRPTPCENLTAAGADREARLADLRRMRVIATSLLALMAAIFLATSATRLDWSWLDYLRAFAEAGMVGACADRFAVVALFRHPLGIAIASPLFHEQAKTLWEQIERGVYADPDGQAEAMARACETGLRTLGHWLGSAAPGSIGGFGCSSCARCCRAAPRSAPTWPKSFTTGTAPPSSTALSFRSARTCNTSASTELWSVASSAS